ncbi:hypothetical protein DWB61_17790 [Ancylomarina euxinus]|uniref:Uncharacterized protein n=1 Tax=Ancylomarina euxinus TaxID=2283627 RepID=A0A425XW93_9BACT|nr:hypothetical protein [Ancylomarina euxinus]MCZ4696506.1 hypothetical protein [Ancylomarina euxinus]MUP16859.1 hypothetical protein [Ancylomarina euxinus]RRG18913.1 hypothetical protein DWB61_17790 [Ancylomarina euxinus]
MNKDIIEDLVKQVQEGVSACKIAEYLGDIVAFESFDDGVNQDRYIVKSKDTNVFVAINQSKDVDWVSISGESINLSYDFFEKISENVKIHHNTYDNSSKIQLIFYPILRSGLQGVLAWVDNEEFKRKKNNGLKLKNLILHFGKNKAPFPSREWAYMLEK